MSKIKIYLACLFYDQHVKHHTVPLNIGYIGNALKQTFGDAIYIELFKYPDKLMSALRREKPDILGLSNYAWNQLLSLKMACFAKRVSKDIFTVMGGPQLRGEISEIHEFLNDHKEIDCYIPFVGEFPFIELVNGILKADCGTKVDQVFMALKSIQGAFLNIPEYEYCPVDAKMLKTIYKFGSPYLNGLLDKFLIDDKLYPLFETNRGCPYSCVFCAFGLPNYRKVFLNDLDTVSKEFQYVAEQSVGQQYWYLADANFGLFPRDIEIAKTLKVVNKKYGFPSRVNSTAAKGSSYKNVIKIVEILKDMFMPGIAVQSFDPVVLLNIKRRNLDEPTIRKLVSIYSKHGIEAKTDILVGLSGESFKSHISSLKKAIDLDLYFIPNTLTLLSGTEMDTAEERSKYGFNVKYRVRADTYGLYDNEFLFEIEELVCGSNTLSFEEFLSLRTIHLLTYMLWSTKIGQILFDFGRVFDIHPMDVISCINKKPSSQFMTQLLENYDKEMRTQLFDSKKELIEHFNGAKRQEELLKGKSVETKLFWKFFAILLKKKDNVIKLIDEVIIAMLSYPNVDSTLLETLRKISIDRLMVNFNNPAVLTKEVEYGIMHQNYLLLRKKEVIPNSVKFKDKKMIVKYWYDKKTYDRYQSIMHRFNFNPQNAINAALGMGIGAHLLYKIVDF